MEGDPSIYYLWLREHPEEACVTLAPDVAPYLRPLLSEEDADEGDLTLAG